MTPRMRAIYLGEVMKRGQVLLLLSLFTPIATGAVPLSSACGTCFEPSFEAAMSFASGKSDLGGAVGNFNGDGIPDLAIGAYGDAAVLLGDGTGRFGPESRSRSGCSKLSSVISTTMASWIWPGSPWPTRVSTIGPLACFWVTVRAISVPVPSSRWTGHEKSQRRTSTVTANSIWPSRITFSAQSLFCS